MPLDALFGWIVRLVTVRPVLFLSRQGNQFTLSAWKHGRPAPLDDVIRRNGALAALGKLRVRAGATGVIVPVEQLTGVRLALQAAVSNRLEVALSPDVAYLSPGTLPGDLQPRD